ncbi:unnamed protein product [Phaedon cochleariae]|uniref:Uncharacterized protein n=1 Tax=Phaedon cochleariae TaxID=80249 RepID=A0A9N9SDE8_PHACE|nr:unnamed protein product [Phaedon cochleariae]
MVDNVSNAVIKSIDKKFSQIEQKVTHLQDELAAVKKSIDNMVKRSKDDASKLIQQNGILEKKLDNIDQDRRKKNLRVFNVKEKDKENTREEILALLRTKLAINLSTNDIVICYRVGKQEEGRKPRGIFLKLKDFNMKQEIYRKKKLLKGTGVVIREDLTHHRIELLAHAVEKTSLQSVWTDKGIIYVNIDNKISIIKSREEFDKLF